MEKLKPSLIDKIKTYISGASSILDFGGALGPRSPYEDLPPDVADSQAIESDWKAVGNDMQSVINTVGFKIENKDNGKTPLE